MPVLQKTQRILRTCKSGFLKPKLQLQIEAPGSKLPGAFPPPPANNQSPPNGVNAMNSHIICPQAVLAGAEYQLIDDFCSRHPGIEHIALIADFLQREFSLPLVLDPQIVEGFASDSSNLPARADALCRPESERQAAIILHAARAAGIEITFSAGRSNLTGSATAQGGIVVSTANLASPPVTVDVNQKVVSTPVGIVLEEMRNSVLAQSGGRLYYPVDPTSRKDAWVGGTLCCNASGFTPGEAGATRPWVQALDFLLPNGMKISAARGQYISQNGKFVLSEKNQQRDWPVPTYSRPSIKNASGPFSSPDGRMDLIDLIVGSEGLFGLITACTLKLATPPEDHLELFFSLPAEEQALEFYDHLGGLLAGNFSVLNAFEYFGVNCRRFMDHEKRLFYGDNQVALYLQIPLKGKSRDEEAATWFERLLAADCGIDPEGILLLDSEPQRRVFLEARHSMPANALEVVQRHGTYTIMTDAVVPPENFAIFLADVHRLLKSEGIDYLSFGHFGDCHLHFTLLPEQEKLSRATELYDLIVIRATELGGVYSGEHGTGKRKRKDFLKLYGQSAIEELKRCKAAVDPDFLINRGNVFVP